MRKFIIFIRKNANNLLNLLFLTASITIIIFFFPGTRKFRYEFQKGSPWQHDNLIAPFDFPIYKLDKEYAEERDSLNRFLKPYFKYFNDLEKNALYKLSDKFSTEIEKTIKQDSINRQENPEYKKNNKPIKNNEYQDAYKILEDNFKFVYSKGIIDAGEILDYSKNKDFAIMVSKKDIAQLYEYGEFFTLKSAYEYINFKINDKYKKLEDVTLLNFIHGLNFNIFIEANLVYDEELTKKVKINEVKNISLTQGFVQAGERIIFKGEVVDDQKFRVLMSLKKEYEQSVGLTSNRTIVLLGQIVVILSFFIALFVFMISLRKQILKKTSHVLLILLLIVGFIVIASLVIDYDLINIYLIPFALSPVIIKVFFDSRLALFVHILTIFTIGFFAPNSFEFILLQFVGGFAAIFSFVNLNKRGQIYKSAAVIFLSFSFLYLGIAMMQEGNFSKIEWIYFAYFLGNALFVLFAYPLIYGFEKIFGMISDVTLLELSDTNHTLLRNLAQKAPGTFQHSMQVANLAEQAAYKIGANPQLARTGALYHDIGKTLAPLFFIENQISGVNPHDKLEFDESAAVIISHVTKGIELAQKHNLPPQIIDFIRTHHGTTKVQYFYRSYIKKYPDKDVDASKFTYPGPKPFSKETAIVMMADSVEAASRSLKTYNEETIANLIENIIEYQLAEKQFSNTDITFKDVSSIKKLFNEALRNIYHTRIEYPK